MDEYSKINKSFSFAYRSRCPFCGDFPQKIGAHNYASVPTLHFKELKKRAACRAKKAKMSSSEIGNVYRKRKVIKSTSVRFHKNGKINRGFNYFY